MIATGEITGSVRKTGYEGKKKHFQDERKTVVINHTPCVAFLAAGLQKSHTIHILTVSRFLIDKRDGKPQTFTLTWVSKRCHTFICLVNNCFYRHQLN